MLTFVLAAICIVLALIGGSALKALSSISSVLSEIRDTQRLESFRLRRGIISCLGEIASMLDPYSRRKRLEYHRRREEDGAKEWALLKEWPEAGPERRTEIEEKRKQIRQADTQREEEEQCRIERAEQEYLEKYPFRRK